MGYVLCPCVIVMKVGNHKYIKNGTEKQWKFKDIAHLVRKMRKGMLEELF